MEYNGMSSDISLVEVSIEICEAAILRSMDNFLRKMLRLVKKHQDTLESAEVSRDVQLAFPCIRLLVTIQTISIIYHEIVE